MPKPTCCERAACETYPVSYVALWKELAESAHRLSQGGLGRGYGYLGTTTARASILNLTRRPLI
jgi:hypothetical protein